MNPLTKGQIPMTEQRNLEVAWRPVAELVPYARNARTHSESQVAQLAASIEQFGWTNPVLIAEDGGIIAGHGRVMAAKLLGLASVPTIVLAHLTPEQRRAYVLADNQLALRAGWDEAMLAQELLELQDAGFELDVIGFTEDELAKLLAPPDLEELGGGEGEDTSGSESRYLEWPDHRVPMTQDELAGLQAAYTRHVEVHGTEFGFVAYLLRQARGA